MILNTGISLLSALFTAQLQYQNIPSINAGAAKFSLEGHGLGDWTFKHNCTMPSNNTHLIVLIANYTAGAEPTVTVYHITNQLIQCNTFMFTNTNSPSARSSDCWFHAVLSNARSFTCTHVLFFIIHVIVLFFSCHEQVGLSVTFTSTISWIKLLCVQSM